MTQKQSPQDEDALPSFVRATEVALRQLAVDSPLRSLIYEQFLDFVTRRMPRERELVMLALMGSADEETRAIAETVEQRWAGGDMINPRMWMNWIPVFCRGFRPPDPHAKGARAHRSHGCFSAVGSSEHQNW